jgi:hypothetical protein
MTEGEGGVSELFAVELSENTSVNNVQNCSK